MSDFRISQVAASPSMTEPSTSGSERKLDRPAVVLGARSICKSFGRRAAAHQVLFDVDVDVYEGECLAVIGGSGSGKTRFFCKPNIYSANCSYLITDPKGELLRAAGALLAAQGYEVRVFNLIDPSQSDGYNPFSYIHSEKDVLTLIDNLIKNTTPRNASSNDPFWEKAEIALDLSLIHI